MKKKPTADIEALAREKLGFPSLRGGQHEAIEALQQGRDTLVVQPTGSGKSAIYQIAGLITEGTTIVVSPLIALQKDQIDGIQAADVAPAAVVNSHQKASEVKDAFARLADGTLEYLFLSPEQLAKPATLEKLQAHPPSLFVVDEAHCISEWGHDFRPDYLRLGGVIKMFGHPITLALTATASELVQQEIVTRLQMREPKVIVKGFDRPNLHLRVDHFAAEDDKREELLKRVDWADKPGIVYVGTRKHAEDLAAALAEKNITTAFYHAGMAPKDRVRIHEEFMAGNTDVIIATNAFGMGVDKADVRFVYHYDISDSIDSYYQEIGRAGRDGEPAEAILFYRSEDMHLPKFLKGGGKVLEAEIDKIQTVLQQADQPLTPPDLHDQTGLTKHKVEKVLNRLEEAGAVERLPDGTVLSVQDADRAQAATQAVEHEAEHREYERKRLEQMQAYAELRTCRRAYILRYFGEANVPDNCGNCDICGTQAQRAQPAA